jgi:hypothetical protein
MNNSPVTPALNNKAIEMAQKTCYDNGAFDKKSFDKAYDQAIKQLGYDPAYFKKCMREIGTEHPDNE